MVQYDIVINNEIKTTTEMVFALSEVIAREAEENQEKRGS
jgi:hypothetical protein